MPAGGPNSSASCPKKAYAAWAALATAFADAGGPVHHSELSVELILGAVGGVDPV